MPSAWKNLRVKTVSPFPYKALCSYKEMAINYSLFFIFGIFADT